MEEAWREGGGAEDTQEQRCRRHDRADDRLLQGSHQFHQASGVVWK